MANKCDTALILAAGRGRRLMPHTKNLPKCLVDVGGKPILYYQLRSLEMNGIRNIFMVVGYKAEKIRRYIWENFPHLNVNFIHNDEYHLSGEIVSFHKAKNHISGNLIQIDGDVLFHPCALSELLSAGMEKSRACFRKCQWGEEEMKVSLGPDNKVLKISKDLGGDEMNGEAVGIWFFTESFMKPFYAAMHEIIQNGGGHGYSTQAMNSVISGGGEIFAVDISHHPVAEIDFPEDLKMAQNKIFPRIKGAFNMV